MKIEGQQNIGILAEQRQQISELNRAISQMQDEKDEFIQLASHELKAPLRKINTFAERLLEKCHDSLNDEGKGYLLRIKKNIDSMQSLIEGLSELSAIGVDKTARCDLNEVAAIVLEEFSPLLLEKKANIAVSPLPVLQANNAQIKEVFRKLIDNSLKFQPAAQAPEITIEATPLTKEEKDHYGLRCEKSYHKIQFSDNGIGLKEKEEELLFKPLVRLNGKSAFHGNGLGLAVCKKIVNAHNGIIYASPNNSGCCITLILPQTAHNADAE